MGLNPKKTKKQKQKKSVLEFMIKDVSDPQKPPE